MVEKSHKPIKTKSEVEMEGQASDKSKFGPT